MSNRQMDLEAAIAWAAMLANVETIDESEKPNTLSLQEIQQIGSDLLEYLTPHYPSE